MVDLAEKSYTHIRRKLLSGEWRLGSRIEEPALALQIGVSRVPVREAIRRLESEGLITRLPRVGAFVPVFTSQDVWELVETREALECYAVMSAAKQITRSALRDLRGIVSELVAAARAMFEARLHRLEGPLAERWLLADIAFHMAIMRVAGNRRAAKIVGDLRLLTWLVLTKDIPAVSLRSRLLTTIGDHVAIWRAIRRRDGATAARLMSEHITSSGRKVVAHLDRERSLAMPVGNWPASHEQLIKAQQPHRV